MIPGNPQDGPGRGSLRLLAVLCILGVGIRLAFLLLAGELELQSDEANYVYLALTWEYFGFYSDSYRYLWPPGYPFVLGLFLRAFDADGIFYIKLAQVLASASVGWFTMLFARRLFGQRAAVLAGIIWCVYLPLIGFTHYLWTETFFLALFLPSIYLVLLTMQDDGADAGSRRESLRLLCAGVLFGLCLYLKEVHLYLAPVLGLLLWLRARMGGLRRGSLFLLAITVVVAPWTLRNYEVYGRFLPIGASLGENCFLGLNAPYKNFDTSPFARHRFDRELPRPREWFVANDGVGEWQRAETITNTADKLAMGVELGMGFVRTHPGWFVRSRIKKLADLALPSCFFVRHQGLEHYADGRLGTPLVRRTLTLASIGLSALVMLFGLAGLWSAVEDRSARWLLTTVTLYFVSTASIVAMSRFRIPFIPFLIALGAGLLTGHLRQGSRRRRTLALLGVGGLLSVLWWIDWPELSGVIDMAWESST
ncbi:MAG: hypothetical protein ACI8QZ_002206 [Chlamydiales bacterium]